MSELRTNRIVPRDGLPSGSSGGIIQVKQTVKTDTFSKNSSSWADITGMSVSITPTRADSKVFVMVDIKIGTEHGDSDFQSVGSQRMLQTSQPVQYLYSRN